MLRSCNLRAMSCCVAADLASRTESEFGTCHARALTLHKLARQSWGVVEWLGVSLEDSQGFQPSLFAAFYYSPS